jgi:hypothetical protein
MRGALVCVMFGMLVSTAHADPFGVRNPVPDAPPSASVTAESQPTIETIDPGYSRRRTGTLVAASALVFWGTSFAVSYHAGHRFQVDVALIDAGIDVKNATADANRAAEIGRTWGTGFFAAGVVAVGVGTYLYVTAPKKFRREHVTVAPAIGGDVAGVTLSGGF